MWCCWEEKPQYGLIIYYVATRAYCWTIIVLILPNLSGLLFLTKHFFVCTKPSQILL